jgi:L-seryl-tRNA(Ser) seleniumtransferase
VDAAAQIPPLSSLWRFTHEYGAAAAIFSGGKGLRGPQDSAIVVGSRAITTGIQRHMAPNHGIGRGMKVTKESLAGILAALEYAFSVDEEQLLAGYEAVVHGWVQTAQYAGLTAHRDYPSEAGQPHSRAFVVFDSPERAAEVKQLLWEREPQVAVLVVGSAIALNPQPLRPGEEAHVSAALVELAAAERAPAERAPAD